LREPAADPGFVVKQRIRGIPWHGVLPLFAVTFHPTRFRFLLGQVRLVWRVEKPMRGFFGVPFDFLWHVTVQLTLTRIIYIF
jgi:hypothetical protein